MHKIQYIDINFPNTQDNNQIVYLIHWIYAYLLSSYSKHGA